MNLKMLIISGPQNLKAIFIASFIVTYVVSFFNNEHVLLANYNKAVKRTGAFPCSSAGKESTCNAGDLGSIPELGRSLEKKMATHSSILAWKIPWSEESGRLHTVHGVVKSRT